jgi:hypothetical protein
MKKRSPAVLLALLSGSLIMALLGLVAPALTLLGLAGAYFAATGRPNEGGSAVLDMSTATTDVSAPGPQAEPAPAADAKGQIYLF